jgi:hypothetical protein
MVPSELPFIQHQVYEAIIIAVTTVVHNYTTNHLAYLEKISKNA